MTIALGVACPTVRSVAARKMGFSVMAPSSSTLFANGTLKWTRAPGHWTQVGCVPSAGPWPGDSLLDLVRMCIRSPCPPNTLRISAGCWPLLPNQ